MGAMLTEELTAHMDRYKPAPAPTFTCRECGKVFHATTAELVERQGKCESCAKENNHAR